MEHIIIEQIQRGYFKLTPESGYILVNKLNDSTYSEAVTKTPRNYYAKPLIE